jgi:ferredoxin
MRARVDRERCVGHGRCYALAPEVYAEDERGHCVAPTGALARGLEASARRGAESCPERAISLDEARAPLSHRGRS